MASEYRSQVNNATIFGYNNSWCHCPLKAGYCYQFQIVITSWDLFTKDYCTNLIGYCFHYLNLIKNIWSQTDHRKQLTIFLICEKYKHMLFFIAIKHLYFSVTKSLMPSFSVHKCLCIFILKQILNIFTKH